MDQPFPSLLGAVAALVFVLCLIVLAGRLVRKTRFNAVPAGGTRLAVVDSLALGPRRRLLLIRCDGNDLLLLTGGTEDVPLGWVPPKP
jgi:flagellar protein FliO/FliZ